MKPTSIIVLILISLIALPVRAQFGNLKNMVPGAGPVSLETLLGDVNSGTDFFNKAALKYAQALAPTKDLIRQNDGNKDAKAGGMQARAYTAAALKVLEEEAKKRKESGEKLSAEAQLVRDGNVEMGKGIAKWGLLGVAIVKAKKDGGKDEKLAAAIVAIEEVLKDLPQISALYKAMQALEGEKQKSKD